MKYREVQYSNDYPEMTQEELGDFLHKLANIDRAAVNVHKGVVVQNDDEPTTFFSKSYLLNWTWNRYDFTRIGKKELRPEPDFVAFINDMVVRLGILEYKKDDPKSLQEFEEAMTGRCTMTKEHRGSGFAFPAARIAYEAWCKAHNRKKIGLENDSPKG